MEKTMNDIIREWEEGNEDEERCPVCTSELDENGACGVCGWYEDRYEVEGH